MKTSVKIVLLVIAIIVFGLALYFCLPIIPKKIKNEIKGTDYTFEDITFNLPPNNYVINEELTNQINEEGNQNGYKTLLLINSQNEKDFITLVKNNEGTAKLIKESMDYLKNPLKHRTLEMDVKKQNNLLSSDSVLLSSPTKEVILHKSTTQGGLVLYFADLIIDNTFYTITPSVVAGKDVVLEFIRTVSTN